MKVYLRNIRAILEVYRSGRWSKSGFKGTISVYKYIFMYTIKYIKVRVFKLKF